MNPFKLYISICLVLFTNIAYANDPISIIETHINTALESHNTKHPGWYKAAELLNPLLKNNNQDAVYYSSFLYAYGTGGYPKDIIKADKLAKQAADSGSLPAMVDQAVRFEYGLSGVTNNEQAVLWYKKSGEAGSKAAASRLTEAYKKGELGLNINKTLATKWSVIYGQCNEP